MNTIKSINRIGQNDLRMGIQGEASWHNDYAESAYIFISNLHYEMSEGDIAIVFSQYGEPVDVHLVKNKKTGVSRGFCFLAYEDQRSSVIAVDNMNAAEVCGRMLRVDHVKQFKPPREFLDVKEDDPEFFSKLYKPSGPDGAGWGDFRERSKQEQEQYDRQAQLEIEKEEMNNKILDNMEQIQNQKYFIDADERWEKMLMDDLNDEKEIMKNKIEELRQQNIRMTKVKKPKLRVVQETNAEQQIRLLGKSKIQKEHKQPKEHKHNKKEKHHKSQ